MYAVCKHQFVHHASIQHVLKFGCVHVRKDLNECMYELFVVPGMLQEVVLLKIKISRIY